MYGWIGKTLRVDLTSRRVSTIDTMKYAKDYLGGLGIALRLYWEEVPPDAKALSPDNKLIFMTGPQTGTIAPTSARTTLVGKSPATTIELVQASSAGGFFGPELKFAGYDGIIIEGKSSGPVYLWINDGKVEIKDARRLWGKDTWETWKTIKDELSGYPTAQVACIGPAGENLVKFSVVLCCNSGSAWGHSGFGAVMGSKNLKAIAVKGTNGVRVKDPAKLLEVSNRIERLVTRKQGENEPPAPHRGQGYLRLQSRYNPKGGELQLDEDARRGVAEVRTVGCHSCPVDCCMIARYEDEDPPGMFQLIRCVSAVGYIPSELEYYGGEKAFGKASYTAIKKCNLLGLDVYEYSDFAGWFSMAIKAEVLTEENTGLPLSRHGSTELWEELFEKVSYREGIGDLFAEGGDHVLRHFEGDSKDENVRKTARKIRQLVWNPDGTVCYFTLGYDSTLQAIVDSIVGGKLMRNTAPYHIYDPVLFHCFPRILPGTKEYEDARNTLAKDLFGLEKLDEHTWSNRIITWGINEGMIMNSLPYCDWSGPWLYSQYAGDHMGDHSLPAQLFAATTGMDMTQEELHQNCAERIHALMRSLEIEEGRTNAFDTLPEGTWAEFDWIDKKDFIKGLREYYRSRGWNRDGIPTRSKLESLGLGDVAERLAKRGIIKR